MDRHPAAASCTTKHPGRVVRLAVVAASGLLVAGGASAQTAGTWLLRAGATTIKPHTDSGNLSAPSLVGTQAGVRSDTEPSGGITYLLTDHVAIDLPVARRFRPDLIGKGAIGGVGKIGDVRSLPITLLGQYRFFDAGSDWRPYLGAGATYAKFYRARGTAALNGITGSAPANPTTLAIESRWGTTLQAGLSYAFAPRWFADLCFTHTFLKTRTTLSTGQTLDIALDPNSLGVSVGYRF